VTCPRLGSISNVFHFGRPRAFRLVMELPEVLSHRFRILLGKFVRLVICEATALPLDP
jgi:hypothetical protein